MQPKKILLCPDSFKGSLSASRVCEIWQQHLGAWFPEAVCLSLPAGDGGEGTLQAVASALGGTMRQSTVTGPRGTPVTAQWATLPNRGAFIELAQASGLPLLPRDQQDPLLTTTRGTGELLRQALELGCTSIYLAIGGSASNDGGMGLGSALGLRFLDREEREVPCCGAGLAQVARIDTSSLLSQLKGASFTVLCDVRNPLLGPEGCAYTFAPQKGASPAKQHLLEAGMARYAQVLEDCCGKTLRDLPGSGAAGGAALPLLAFTDTTLRSGSDAVLSLLEFDRMLEGADLVITGEGRLDGQSAQGKLLSAVGQHCKKPGIPVIALAGSLGSGAQELHRLGVEAIFSSLPGISSEAEAMAQAEEHLHQAAEELCRLLHLGIRLGEGPGAP